MDKSTHEIRLAKWTNILTQCQNRPEGQTIVEGVKTSKELGMTMSITSTIRGYAYKTGTPQEIVDYISAVFELCEKDPGFIEECAALGLDKCIDYKNPADTTKFMEEQYESYKKYCEAQGIAK